MDSVLLYDGSPLLVQGFANVYGREAETESGVEVFRPGAFASFLKAGAQDVVATWGHDRFFEWARKADGSLRLWETPVGLCFEAMIESTPRGRGLADFVAQGNAVASITFMPMDFVKTARGREVLRATLSEICIFFEAAYPTAVWLAGDAQPDTLTPRAQDLRRRWTVERQTRSVVDRVSKRVPARTASARAQQSQALAAVSDEEALLPPSNMSLDEWLDFGRSCAHAARWIR
jgi:HK97 family phage prohead protease